MDESIKRLTEIYEYLEKNRKVPVNILEDIEEIRNDLKKELETMRNEITILKLKTLRND